MELLKDYDCTIVHHPVKANVVIDALSHKSIGSLAHINEARRLLISAIHRLEANGVKFEIKESRTLLAHMELHSSLSDQIKVVLGKNP